MGRCLPPVPNPIERSMSVRTNASSRPPCRKAAKEEGAPSPSRHPNGSVESRSGAIEQSQRNVPGANPAGRSPRLKARHEPRCRWLRVAKCEQLSVQLTPCALCGCSSPFTPRLDLMSSNGCSGSTSTFARTSCAFAATRRRSWREMTRLARNDAAGATALLQNVRARGARRADSLSSAARSYTAPQWPPALPRTPLPGPGTRCSCKPAP